MARTPKRLAGPQLIDSTAETIYTVPGATSAVIKDVVITNNTGASVDVTLAIGDATVQANRFLDAFPCANDAATNLFFYIPMATGETLRAFASTDDTTTITVGGDEYT